LRKFVTQYITDHHLHCQSWVFSPQLKHDIALQILMLQTDPYNCHEIFDSK